MLESGIDPATVRFEVGKNPYCKYSICSGARAIPPGIIELYCKYTIFIVSINNIVRLTSEMKVGHGGLCSGRI